MTQPLNYTTKAIESLSKVATLPTIGPIDRKGLHFVRNLLMRAEVFTLPDGGALLERDRPRPEVPGLLFKPPFPVTALEYAASSHDGREHPLYEATSASKRIALAWEWDGKTPDKDVALPVGLPDCGGGVFVASICYFDDVGFWLPVAAAALVPYDFHYEVGEPSQHQAAMIATGRINKKQLVAPKIPIKHALLLMPEWFHKLSSQFGGAGSVDMVSADLMDEFNAFADLSVALACRNVTAQRCAQPDKLNKSRIKSGKPPLKDYHVLTIDGSEYAIGSGRGHGHGVRSHLRRGHIRRLGAGRVTWVNSTIVNGSKPGFARKAYAVAALGGI